MGAVFKRRRGRVSDSAKKRASDYEGASASLNVTKTPVSAFSDRANVSYCAELELVDKLEQVREMLDLNENILDFPELSKVSQSAKDYILLREKLRSEVPDPLQFDSKTDLNLGSAAIAGAKVFVDGSRTTRSMTKKLVEQCGINKQDFLYKGLKRSQREFKCAQDMAKLRRSAVIESLIDFRKQIDFKEKVLKRVANRHLEKKSKSDSRAYRLKRLNAFNDLGTSVLKTPSGIRNTSEINPLDDQQILESYADHVAAEATRLSTSRSFGTVPFNKALLDEED